MPFNTNIEIAVSKDVSNTEKGRLLENLGKEILETMNYKVLTEVRITGMEVDLIAQHEVTDEEIYVECKAHKSNLSADVLTKLLGNVDFRGVSSGWLLTTGPLGKDAKGLFNEWEKKPPEEKKRLQVYTNNRIIDLLIKSNRICSPLKIDKIDSKNYAENNTLLVTNYGMYWLAPIMDTKTGVPFAVNLFDAKTGDRIINKEIINKISKTDNSFTDLEWSVLNIETVKTYGNNLSKEWSNVIEVSSGDKWADYRPSRPQDFVGRQKVRDDIFKYIEKVRMSESSTRLLALTAPSGWGKSSTLLKLIDTSLNNKDKYFIYAVDLRAAMSSRYAEFSFKKCIESAINKNFISNPKNPITISNINNPFEDSSMQEVCKELHSEKKVIVLFFDQFEETFAKKELMDLFTKIRQLSHAIDSIKENIILGFAWKTDVVLPAEHSAYHMWHNLSDRRIEFDLTPFSNDDILRAINIFSNELNESINPVFENYLIDQCQGYPWLLKKLCIHMYRLLQQGADQTEILGRGLDINELFEKDLSELNSAQITCIKKIANNSPADFFEIDELFGKKVINTLMNRRLILRKGAKLILYWDIFRDYVITGEIPPIPITYIPQTSIKRYYETLQILLKHNSLSVKDLASILKISTKATNNIVRDLVMIGNAERVKGVINLLQGSEANALDKMQEFLNRHILLRKLRKKQNNNVISVDEFESKFLELYSDDKFTKATQTNYFNRITNWLHGLELIKNKGNSIVVHSENNIKNDGNIKSNINRTAKGTFFGQAPAKRVTMAIKIIHEQKMNKKELEANGYRNALTILRAFDMIYSYDDNIELTFSLEKNPNKLYYKLKDDLTMLLIDEYVKESEEVDYIKIGNLLEETFDKSWSDASKKRYGGALFRWYKWLKEQEKIVG